MNEKCSPKSTGILDQPKIHYRQLPILKVGPGEKHVMPSLNETKTKHKDKLFGE